MAATAMSAATVMMVMMKLVMVMASTFHNCSTMLQLSAIQSQHLYTKNYSLKLF
jgi:hypothetical protein